MFAPPLPAPTSHVAQATADAADATNFPVRAGANRDPYLGIMRGSPLILEAMDYENQPLDCRQGIWAAIDDYDVDGTIAVPYPPDSPWPVGSDLVRNAGMPPGYDRDNVSGTAPPFYYVPQGGTGHQTVVNLNRAQAIDAFSAKVAHALYHELQGTFPWSITEYDLESHRGLFDPVTLWQADAALPNWDLDGNPAAVYEYSTIDHVPQEAYDAAVGFMGSPATALGALANIHSNALQDTEHIVFGDAFANPAWAIKVADIFYPADRAEWISRFGCHSAAAFCAALARAVNIPALRYLGYFATRTVEEDLPVGHSSIGYPSVNRMWCHGDFIYQLDFLNTGFKGMATSVTLDDWKSQVLPGGTNSYEASRESIRLSYEPGENIPDPQILRTSSSTLYGKNYFLSTCERHYTPLEASTILERVWSTALQGGANPTESALYGRLECYPDEGDVQYETSAFYGSSSPPDAAALPMKGSFATTSAVGNRVILWNDQGEGRVAYNVTVNEGETTVVRPAIVEVTGPGGLNQFDYEISPHPVTGVGVLQGTASGALVERWIAQPGTYTLTWLDNVPGLNPSPATEGPATIGMGDEANFGPANYVPE